MDVLTYFVEALLIFILGCTVYLKCNQGMARNARGQQTRRFLITTLLSILPLAVTGTSLLQPRMLLGLGLGVLWMVTYPLLFHLTNRKTSPDYENYMDITFGIYIFGWLSALNLLCPWGWLVALVELPLMLVPLFQIIYFVTYRVCIDDNGMKLIQETDVNEVVEFFRSFAWWQNALAVLPAVLLTAALFVVNGRSGANVLLNTDWHDAESLIRAGLVIGLFVFFSIYTFKPHHGVFGRTGIAMLYANVREYAANNLRYIREAALRMQELRVEPLGRPSDKPHTIMMVIGESASRDFMSAYHPDMKEDTTPWLRASAADSRHFLLFRNAYSCTMQTVPTLEKALTERSQYNLKPFYESCSIVDIAHKLGYTVHWYSNQGHLGAADTPITLVANTAETAKWTRQEVNRVQYDETLISFLDEVDPTQNNLVVLHLMGSHFNFMSRYPAAFTRWGQPGVQENVTNYKNSLAYTDHVLQQFYEYACSKLNLEAMVYFSDHATEPGRRRKPNFDSFQMVRIPFFAFVSEDYIDHHPERYAMMARNQDKYFTNDLIYDFMCGLMDVQSNHFSEAECLASSRYRYTRGMLLTYDGKKPISMDNERISYKQ